MRHTRARVSEAIGLPRISLNQNYRGDSTGSRRGATAKPKRYRVARRQSAHGDCQHVLVEGVRR